MAETKNNSTTNELGFGSKTGTQRARLLNRDGNFTMQKRGLSKIDSFNLYHHLINLSLFRFIVIIVLTFTVLNLLFTGMYLAIGIEHLTGIVATDAVARFWETFFFSTQTFTTVGYGRVNPVGLPANIISSAEALSGLMSFAVITGLIYGRFSKPRANILYSKNALIAPYKNGKAVMFRLANKLNTNLIDLEVRLILAYLDKKTGNRVFEGLKLELDKINFLPSAWTLVHAIDENSKFNLWTDEDFITNDIELLVVFKAYDETFCQMVNNRFSYKSNELVMNAKFQTILFTDEEGFPYVELDRISEYDKLETV